jgi:hypothetical protein
VTFSEQALALQRAARTAVSRAPSAVCRLPSAVCRLPSAVCRCRLPSAVAVCCLPSAVAVCRLPSAVCRCRLPSAVCRLPLPFAVCRCCLLFAVCRLPSAVCRLPFAVAVAGPLCRFPDGNSCSGPTWGKFLAQRLFARFHHRGTPGHELPGTCTKDAPGGCHSGLPGLEWRSIGRTERSASAPELATRRTASDTAGKRSWESYLARERTVLAEALTELEQGVVLAALMDGRAAEDRLSRLEGEWGGRCVAAYREAAALAPGARRQEVQALSRQLFVPWPSNLHRVHASWIEHLLAEESPLLSAAVWETLPSDVASRLKPPRARTPERPHALPPALRGEICRAVLGSLVPMPSPRSEDASLQCLDHLPAWPPERVQAALECLGCLVVAAVAGRTEAFVAARVADAMAPRHRVRVREAMAAPPILLPRGLRPGPARRDPLELVAYGLGADVLRPALAPMTRRQAAQLLPRPIGSMLLEGGPGRREAEAVLGLFRRADAWARGEGP